VSDTVSTAMFSGTNSFGSSMEDMTSSSRHARACPGHPRL
jgi:hypothetical protein